MAHVRTQVRNEVAAALTAAGLSVFTNITHVIQPTELPCVIITTDNENLQLATQAGYDRDIELTIKLFDRAYDGVDDDIDANSVIIENTMRNNTTLTAHEKNLDSVNIDIADGDQQIAVASYIYSIILYDIENPEYLI